MLKAATAAFKGEYSREIGLQLGNLLVSKLGEIPAACWLFCSTQKRVEDLLRGVIEACECDNLIGCTTDGELSGDGFSTGSAVLAGIATDEIEFHRARASGLARGGETAGRKLAEKFPPQVAYLQVFSDGLTGNGSAVIRGIQSVLGQEICIHGGTAGDDGHFERTLQFDGTKILTDSIVGMAFTGEFKFGTGVQSGWSPVGIAKRVTRAWENVVYELNGQPALEVYERFLGKHATGLPAVGVEYPLGLVPGQADFEGDDFFLLRATMSVNREQGSIAFAGEIPEGSLVRLTCGDYASILAAAESAAHQAVKDLGDSPIGIVFVYSCMARKIVLGRRTGEELERIKAVVGNTVPIVGFYTYGEYCPVKGRQNCFHNETVTISVIGA